MKKIIIFSGLILLLTFILWRQLAELRTADSTHTFIPAQAEKTGAREPAAREEVSQGNEHQEDMSRAGNESKEEPAHDGVDVFGVVRDQAGSPISGAEVKAFQGGDNHPGGEIVTATLADGSYSLSGLHFPSGSPYQVVASAEGYAPAFSGLFFIRHPPEKIDLTLTKGASLSGHVMDESRRAIPGATVELTQGGRSTPGSRIDENNTDADGAYALKLLSPGEYWLVVSAKGYIDQRRALVVAPHETQPAQDFVLEYAGAGYCSGVVLDENDQPLEGVEVRGDQYYVGALRTGHQSRICSSSADGSFLLEGFIESGSDGNKVPITLYAMKEGYKKSNTTVFSGDRSVLIRLQKDLLGSISGRVVEAVEGNPPTPVTEFQVEILRQYSPFAFRHFQSTTGEFLFPDIPEDTYDLRVSAPNRSTHFQEFLVVKSGEETSAGEIRLTRGATITGRVRGKGKLEPLAGAMVYIKTGMAPKYLRILTGTSTDETGFYRLEGVPPGSNYVLASHPDYATAISPKIEVEEGKEYSNIDLILGNGGAIEGHVTDNGIPLAGQIISITPVSHPDSSGRKKVFGRRIHIQVDENGHYYKDKLMPGLYFCFARIPSRDADVTGEGNSSFDTVEIVEGEITKFDIDLCAGSGCVKGKVTSEFSIPPEAKVFMEIYPNKMDEANPTNGKTHDILISLGSSYSFDNVCPGEYFIRTSVISETPGGSHDVPCRLDPPGRLVVKAGRITQRDVILTQE
jgi:protocatechuate 3,4-dioxygenase beta subunit